MQIVPLQAGLTAAASALLCGQQPARQLQLPTLAALLATSLTVGSIAAGSLIRGQPDCGKFLSLLRCVTGLLYDAIHALHVLQQRAGQMSTWPSDM